MKMVTKKFIHVSAIILFAVSGGALSFWIVHRDAAREFSYLKKNALCVLDLPAGVPSVSASFTTQRKIKQFEVGIQSRGNHERLSLSISGSTGLICRVTVDDKNSRFGCGGNIPPGIYKVLLSQEPGSKGASVVIAGEKPVLITGWQVWSRAYLGLVVLSGIWAILARKSGNQKQRTICVFVFRQLLLCCAMLFLYLLFHEGGHSLAEIIFGRYDFSRSDFWGVHGNPHSGGKSGPPLEAWQQAIISGGGPLFPTFVAWVLFLLWRSRVGRNLRSVRPTMNLYGSTIIAFLVFTGFIVTPGYLSGIMEDGDWIGFITNVHGPSWLVKGLLWGSFLISAIVLWRVVPEVWRTWKGEFQGLRVSQISESKLS